MKKSILIILFILSFSIYSQEISWNNTLSTEYTFNVPDNIKSLLISVEYADTNSDVIIHELTSPIGTKYITSNIGKPSESRIPPKVHTVFRSKTRMTYVTKGKFSAFINNTQEPIQPGEWKLIFANQNKGIKSSQIFVNIKYIQDEETSPLNLNIDINADIEKSNISKRKLQESLQAVKNFYKSYNINLKFNTVTAWNDHTNTSDLEKKIEILQIGKRKNLQLYLVKRQSTIKKDFQGVAGCLPIVIIENTDQHCSVLIAFEDQINIPYNKMIKVISHEIAHSLGLYHLNDDYFPFGKVYDSMTDTHEETDYPNVMHKTSDYFGHINLSKQQEETVQSNIILQLNASKRILLN